MIVFMTGCMRRGDMMAKKFEKLYSSPDPLGGIDPPSEMPEIKWIDVNGREEYEAILKDAAKCAELGLDRMFETMVYLQRWGGWLRD